MGKYSFDFNVAALTQYSHQLDTNLIYKAYASYKTLSMITKYPIKSRINKINLVNDNLYVTNKSCTPASVSGVSFKQVTLTACDLRVQEKYCKETIEDYWLAEAYALGIVSPDIKSIAGVIDETNAKKMAEYLEYTAWQGVAGGSGSYSKCDGIIVALSGSSDTVRQTWAHSSYTYANQGWTNWSTTGATLTVDKFINAIPAGVKTKQLTLFVGTDVFFNIVTNLEDSKSGMFVGKDLSLSNWEIIYPKMPNLKIVGVVGLDGTTHGVLLDPKQIYTPVDGAKMQEVALWYSQDDDATYYRGDFLSGFVVTRPEEAVVNF